VTLRGPEEPCCHAGPQCLAVPVVDEDWQCPAHAPPPAAILFKARPMAIPGFQVRTSRGRGFRLRTRPGGAGAVLAARRARAWRRPGPCQCAKRQRRRGRVTSGSESVAGAAKCSASDAQLRC
jgi:hypothetical protein